MALPSTRLEFKIALSDTTRGVDAEVSAVVARHPSETQDHVVLRVLAYCLLYDERLEFGPGLCDGDGPDLDLKDLTGRTTAWIECGALGWDKARRAISQSSGATLHAVFAGEKRRSELMGEIEALPRRPKELGALALWTVDPALVAALAAKDARRQKWTVTVVEGHLYVEADGESLDGALDFRRCDMLDE